MADIRLILTSGLAALFMFYGVFMTLAYGGAVDDEERLNETVNDLRQQLSSTERQVEMSRANADQASENLHAINNSFNRFKDEAHVIAYSDGYYETSYNVGQVDVLVANLGDSEANNITGICGLYEDASDSEASDAFYIDLQDIASNQFEYRSYEVDSADYDIESVEGSAIRCFAYSASNGVVGSSEVNPWAERVSEFENLADESIVFEEL